MIVKLQPSHGTFSIFALLNSEVTVAIFTKISHDIEALVQVLKRAFSKRHCITFRNDKAKSERSQFRLVIIGTFHELRQNLCQFYNPHSSVYQHWNCGDDQSRACWDIWYEIPIFAILSKKCSFCPRNLCGYWTNLDQICNSKYVKNIAIKYFWIGIAIIESISERQRVDWWLFRQICQKLVAIATSLKESQKEVRINKVYANTIPFGKKNHEKRCFRSI